MVDIDCLQAIVYSLMGNPLLKLQEIPPSMAPSKYITAFLQGCYVNVKVDKMFLHFFL